MSKSPAPRVELRTLDAALHELIAQLWQEGSKEAFKKVRRVKIYAIRSFVALHPDAGSGGTCTAHEQD
jgi:hypothetical protein